MKIIQLLDLQCYIRATSQKKIGVDLEFKIVLSIQQRFFRLIYIQFKASKPK